MESLRSRPRPRRRIRIRGKLVEVWENPDVPFAYSVEAFERCVQDGDWVLLFNALTLAGGRVYLA